MATIGIDLGTTNSCAATVEGGRPVIVPNAEGERTTPSVIAFSKEGERLVGTIACRQAAVNPDRTIESVKRRMGSDWRANIDGKPYSPQELSAMILRKLRRDAEAIEKAGAFAVVFEMVPAGIATELTASLAIPTIGIGAGAGCDGQVLVYQDMLGMNMDFTPKFAKQFDNIGERMVDAFRAYMNEVQNGTFPTEKQSFVKSDCSDEYLAKLDAEF